MSNAPTLSLAEVECYERSTPMRLAFRFGVTTVTHADQLVARVRIRLPDGRNESGVAAESLAAKWFDKNLALSDEDNRDQLRLAVLTATDLYRQAGAQTAFGLFAGTYSEQQRRCRELGMNALTANYGPALLDRAILDALGKLYGLSFAQMVQRNLPGIDTGQLTPDLSGFDLPAFLETLHHRPTINVRHTVGLVDPITRADQSERVEDGLPETLEEVARHYGCRYYKLKVGGNVTEDLERLIRIAAALDELVGDYRCTLDGNEQYEDVEGVAELWRRMGERPELARLMQSVLFVEQPIKRAVALSRPIAPLAAERSVIIDESDGTLDSFVEARALGYDGVSSKSCKGLYKSILNAARCAKWNADAGRERHFMSAEDLTTWAGVSVQQDLALVSALGLTHVERNGHHFIDGMSFAPRGEQQTFLAAHGDLYHSDGGTVRMKIDKGQIAIGTLDCPGFAVAAACDWSSMKPMKDPGREPIRPKEIAA